MLSDLSRCTSLLCAVGFLQGQPQDFFMDKTEREDAAAEIGLCPLAQFGEESRGSKQDSMQTHILSCNYGQ